MVSSFSRVPLGPQAPAWAGGKDVSAPGREDGPDRHPRPRRVGVIANPAAGQRQGRRLSRALTALHRAGCRVEVQETLRPGDATRFARALAESGKVDVVVAAGGDGTINEVANALAGSPVALGVLPLGTANVLAREVGLPLDPVGAARVIAEGRRRAICLGELTLSAETPMQGPRRFVLMASAGFDAQVVAGVEGAVKRRWGALAYVREAWRRARRAAAGADTCYVVVTTPQGRYVVDRAATVVVCNGRRYGGPFVAAPKAALDQPEFQVLLLARSGLWNTLRYGLALILGRLHRLSDVTVLAATRVSIAQDGAYPLQADGDILAHMPVELSVSPQRLTLLVPADRAAPPQR